VKFQRSKTPRILAAMKNLSTPAITHDWLLHCGPGRKVLTVCAQAKSLVWRAFWRSADVEKLRKALEKKAISLRGTKAEKAGCVNLAASFFMRYEIELAHHASSICSRESRIYIRASL
jgi:hypothetical protein